MPHVTCKYRKKQNKKSCYEYKKIIILAKIKLNKLFWCFFFFAFVCNFGNESIYAEHAMQLKCVASHFPFFFFSVWTLFLNRDRNDMVESGRGQVESWRATWPIGHWALGSRWDVAIIKKKNDFNLDDLQQQLTTTNNRISSFFSSSTHFIIIVIILWLVLNDISKGQIDNLRSNLRRQIYLLLGRYFISFSFNTAVWWLVYAHIAIDLPQTAG